MVMVMNGKKKKGQRRVDKGKGAKEEREGFVTNGDCTMGLRKG